MSGEKVEVNVENAEKCGDGEGSFGVKVDFLVASFERAIAKIQDPKNSANLGASFAMVGKRDDVAKLTEDSTFVVTCREFLEKALGKIKGYTAKVEWGTRFDTTSDTAQIIWSVVLSKPYGKL